MKVYYSGTLLVQGDNVEDILRERANVMLAFGYSIGNWLERRIKPMYRGRKKRLKK